LAELLLIGVGNPYRRDDAVGLFVARELAASMSQNMRVVECSGEGVEIMQLLESCSGAVIVDAVNSGEPAGTIHHLDAGQRVIPSDFFNYSTHAFSVAEAIEMMRVLGSLPQNVVLMGVEGADFSAGEGLSDVVRNAYSDLLKGVIDACRSMTELSSSPHASS